VAANLVIGTNRRVRREWSFDPASGTVYAAGDFVDLVFDTETRRAVEIPAGFRAELERWHHPELA
jgi:acyl-CoA thioesterase FadM